MFQPLGASEASVAGNDVWGFQWLSEWIWTGRSGCAGAGPSGREMGRGSSASVDNAPRHLFAFEPSISPRDHLLGLNDRGGGLRRLHMDRGRVIPIAAADTPPGPLHHPTPLNLSRPRGPSRTCQAIIQNHPYRCLDGGFRDFVTATHTAHQKDWLNAAVGGGEGR